MEEKKTQKMTTGGKIILVLIILAAIGYILFIKTDIFSKKTDMSGNEYTGKWTYIGTIGNASNGEKYLTLMSEIQPDGHEWKFEESFSITLKEDGTIYIYDPEIDKEYHGAWSEENDVVTVKAHGSETEKYEKAKTVHWINEDKHAVDVTPAELGYDSEYFLVGLDYGLESGMVYIRAE